jgi:hypothetical protein
LNSRLGTSLPNKYCPDGALAGIDPAGDIWSVVIEFPKLTNTLASVILERLDGISSNSLK